VHVRSHPPPKVDTPETVTDPQQQLFQLRSPSRGQHFLLHAKPNAVGASPVTMCLNLIFCQLARLWKAPLISGDDELPLEY
jgi:hypothetical protein